MLSDDQVVSEASFTAGVDGWQTCTIQAVLDAGQHTLEFVGTSATACGFNWFQLDYVGSSSVEQVSASSPVAVDYYNLQGQRTDVPLTGINIVVTRMSDGRQQVTKMMNQ